MIEQALLTLAAAAALFSVVAHAAAAGHARESGDWLMVALNGFAWLMWLTTLTVIVTTHIV